MRRLSRVISVYNVDGSLNQLGGVTHTTELVMEYQGHREDVRFEVTQLGSVPVIIGLPWLAEHNPEIDWQTGHVHMTRCPDSCFKLWPKSKWLRQVEEQAMNDMEYVWRMIRRLEDETAQKPEKADVRPADLVPRRLHKYLSVFSKKESERMPVRKPWDHAIELKEGFVPRKGRNIPLSPQEQEEVKEFVTDQLQKGYIRPSKSPQTAPVFFVPKKDGRKRMVQDYRYLNEWTVKNNYPIPLISEIIDKVKDARLFTKLDLRWGYNNVRIKEGDQWKAAFTCYMGSFEPEVMYFGLCNSPATFQNMMNDILGDLPCVVVYIDDILIFTLTDNEDEHLRIVEEVLKRLEQHDLYAKPEKCVFLAKEVDFLGMVVGGGKVRMDQEKVEAILNWPTPVRVKGVRAFIGLANFYRRFIKDFSKIARPLHDLTKKDVP